MVEVVVPFAECYESYNSIIARRVAVSKWLLTHPMGQRVDTESGLLADCATKYTSIKKTTLPVVPEKTAKNGRQDE